MPRRARPRWRRSLRAGGGRASAILAHVARRVNPNSAPCGFRIWGSACRRRSGCQPLVTTGCGYLPIGYLPTGYLPIGALPTGGAGGGGSLRGRSAAAAALSMAKDAAVTVRIFSIINPLLFGPCLRQSCKRGTGAAPRRSLHLESSGAALLDALADTVTQ